MIKLKLGQIVNAEPAFVKFDKLTKDEKLNFKVTYKLAKLIGKIQPELKDYYEQRDKVLNKYGIQETAPKVDEKTGETIQEATGQWEIKPENREKFKKYIEQLINFDVELVNVFPFTEVELEPIDGLTTDDLFLLAPFIEQTEKPEDAPERKKIEISFDEETPEAPVGTVAAEEVITIL